MEYDKYGISVKKNKVKQIHTHTHPVPQMLMINKVSRRCLSESGLLTEPGNLLLSKSGDFYTTTRNNIFCNIFPFLLVCAGLGGGLDGPSL